MENMKSKNYEIKESIKKWIDNCTKKSIAVDTKISIEIFNQFMLKWRSNFYFLQKTD